MKTPDPNLEDPRLTALLREAHPAPPLPPRFQEGVWQRLERAERPAPSVPPAGWLEQWVRRLLRPGYATAGLVLAMFAGAWLGVRNGAGIVHRADRDRYIAAVSPLHRALP